MAASWADDALDFNADHDDEEGEAAGSGDEAEEDSVMADGSSAADSGDTLDGDADPVDEFTFATSLGRLLARSRTDARSRAPPVPLARAKDFGRPKQGGGSAPASIAAAAAAVKAAAAARAGAFDGSAKLKGAFGTITVPAGARPDDPEVLKQFSGRPLGRTAGTSFLTDCVTIEHDAKRPLGLPAAGLPSPGEVKILLATSVGPGVAGRRAYFTVLVTPDPPGALSDVAVIVIANSGVLPAVIAVLLELRAAGFRPEDITVDMPEELLSTTLSSLATTIGYVPDAIGPRAESTILMIGGGAYRPIGETLEDLSAIRTRYCIISGSLKGALGASQLFIGLVRRREDADSAYFGVVLESAGLTSVVHPGPLRARHQAKINAVLPFTGTIVADSITECLGELCRVGGVRRATTVALAADVTHVPEDQSIRFITTREFLALGDDEFATLITVTEILAAMTEKPARVVSKPWAFKDTVAKTTAAHGRHYYKRVLRCLPATLHTSTLARKEPGLIAHVAWRTIALLELTIKVGSKFLGAGSAAGYVCVPQEEFYKAMKSALNATQSRVSWAPDTKNPDRLVECGIALAGYELIQLKTEALPKLAVLVAARTGPVGTEAFTVRTLSATISTASTEAASGPPVRIAGVNLVAGADALMITLTSQVIDPVTLAEVLCAGIVPGVSPKITTIALAAVIQLKEKESDPDWGTSVPAFKASLAGTAQLVEVPRSETGRLEALRALLAD